jgi:ribosome-associated toxin RatA of RatAB toxin-antitoxin module
MPLEYRAQGVRKCGAWACPAASVATAHSFRVVALVFVAGLGLANGTARNGQVGHTAAFVQGHVARAAKAPKHSPVPMASRQLQPQVRWRTAAPRVALRMHDEGQGDDQRLLWSRRLSRAVLVLRTSPDEGQVPDPEDRLLWSRRLARVVKVLCTSPDTMPAAAPQETIVSSARMLKEAEICDFGEEEQDADEEDDCAFRPNLPSLTEEDLVTLQKGGRVQRQTRDGRVGTGMVVVDVDADLSTVFAVLTDIDRYPERISTVRAAVTYERGEKLLKTQFQISKFRLQINTELRCARADNMLEFKMDPERPAPFLEDARGFWYLEDVRSTADSPRTRIWLVADLACSSLLPTTIIDYAAARALPRATSWLKPVMENLAGELPLVESDEEASEGLTAPTGFR